MKLTLERKRAIIDKWAKVLLALVVFAAVLSPVIEPMRVSAMDEPVEAPASTWIIKWKGTPSEEFLEKTEVIEKKQPLGVWVVRPVTGVDAQAWAQRWGSDPQVEYLQPNQSVQLFAAPNDEYYSVQSFLKQIHAPEAWDVKSTSSSITIALIDTGVDLTHPDLKGNLINGVNLIHPGQKPQDDHGHGTNVAGVVAAIGNNSAGVTGVSWKAKIMPIKALESDGQGDEDKLGEGIRYAVDNGAQIVVMSVGLHRYSPFMQEIADYAEQKGVLLISATGNEGREVKYPAAYPTVVAVGGVATDNQVMLESNYGPEVDLVAPWEVFTTELGGDYAYNQGTSMAAPQVAGAAALIWSKYPSMKPYEVRNLLQQTAQDIEANGWDPYAGYGLLRVDRALKETYKTDMFEPNDVKENAKRLPLDTMVYGELGSGLDTDWFFLDPLYKGKVKLNFTAAKTSGTTSPKLKITYYPPDGGKAVEYTDIVNNPPTLPVTLGKSRIAIQFAGAEKTDTFAYKLVSSFEIYRDDFEDNDRQYKAYSIPEQVHALTGTFHQLNDQDWYSIQVNKTGSLQLSVTPDSDRIDAAVMVQKNGEKAYLLDQNAEGGIESLSAYDVTPGRYYILVSNVISDNAYPVRGEYELKLQITPKLIDPNEPNDKTFQSTKMVQKTEYRGLIDKSTDQDWFSFQVSSDSYVRIRLKDIPEDRLMLMTLYDSKQTQLQLNINSQAETELGIAQVLKKGTYYIKLGANKPFAHKLYRLEVQADPLVAGFRDIKGHWAESVIADLVKQGYLNGYGDYTFRPDRAVTRAEAVSVLVKAFGFIGSSKVSFTDLKADHWAAGAIGVGVKAGMVSGYSDGSFRPDDFITRAEMAVMIARGMGLKDAVPKTALFTDVPKDHWAAGWLAQLNQKQIVSGYQDGSFQPDNRASRAEMAVVTAKILKR